MASELPMVSGAATFAAFGGSLILTFQKVMSIGTLQIGEFPFALQMQLSNRKICDLTLLALPTAIHSRELVCQTSLFANGIRATLDSMPRDRHAIFELPWASVVYCSFASENF